MIGRTRSGAASFPQIPFDALAYGIPPTALASIEPVQLLALEAAQRALRDAGYEGRPFERDRTSVIFGTEAGSDLARAKTLRMMLRAYLDELPPELDEQLPRLTEDSFPGKLVNVISGRIANRLDLGGANYTVDAACGSSLAAVDAACKELLAGTSDMVLCGGADLHNSIDDFLLFSSVGALSPTGRCRPFDADGRRHRPRRGGGLRRPQAARRRRARRRPDLRGDQGRRQRQRRPRDGAHGAAGRRAAPGPRAGLRRTPGWRRREVGLVEAHGTGTVVGDRTELTTLTQVFTEGGAAPGSCALGSVKSQIGHTKCAAGMAGLIKAALALHTGVLPPTRITRPNPALGRGREPVRVPYRAGPLDRACARADGRGERVRLRRHELPPGAVRAPHRGAGQARARRLARRALPRPRRGPHRGRPPDATATHAAGHQRRGGPAVGAARLRADRGGVERPGGVPGAAGFRGRGSGRAHPARPRRDRRRDTRRGPRRAGRARRPGSRAVPRAGQPAPRHARRPVRRVAGAAPRSSISAAPRSPPRCSRLPPFGADETRAQRDRLRATQMAQPALGIAGLADA